MNGDIPWSALIPALSSPYDSTQQGIFIYASNY